MGGLYPRVARAPEPRYHEVFEQGRAESQGPVTTGARGVRRLGEE